MKRILITLRLLSLFAFVPVLYLLVNNLTDNWLYYVCILVIVISFFTIQLILWKTGEQQKVKKTMTAIGFMAFVMLLLFFIYVK